MNKLILILFIIIRLSNVGYSQQKTTIIQYKKCDEIIINLDSINLSAPKDNTMTVVILRAESTKDDNDKRILPFDNYKLNRDSNFVHVIEYELIPTVGVYSCYFAYILNGHRTNLRAIPPKVFITTNDTLKLNIIQRHFQLIKSNTSDKFLLVKNPYSNSDDFFQELDKVTSKYNQEFVSKNFTPPPISPNAPLNQIGFYVGIGSFTQKHHSALSKFGNSHQSFESLPMLFDIGGQYKANLSEHFYIKFGLNFSYLSYKVYSKFLYDLPVSQKFINSSAYTIDPLNPLASSKYLMSGVRALAGYSCKLVNKIMLNIDGGLGYNKSLSGSSKADFTILHNSKTKIDNESKFSDKYGLCFITNANIEFPINGKCSFQLGVCGMKGYNKINVVENYQLIDDNGKYISLENATDKIDFQSLSIITGLVINMK